MLILVVDLGFELFNALSYAWDPAENRTGLMKLPPRKPVTYASIERLRRKEAEAAAHAPPVDPETGEAPPPNFSMKLRKFGRTLKAPFTKQYWKELFEDTEEDVLVDGNVMSWAYL